MYIRFIVRKQDSSSKSFVGLFTEAYELRRASDLEAHEDERLEAALQWMRVNLNIPQCLKDDSNKRAICWFKPAAKKPLAHVWEIVSILRERGIPIEMVKSADPGVIIYEDGWQIAAKPHKTDRVRFGA